MPGSPVDAIIKHAISNIDSVKILKRSVATLLTINKDEVKTFITAICEIDISKAAALLEVLPDDLKACCKSIVDENFQQIGHDKKAITLQELSGILEFDQQDLFSQAFPNITKEVIKKGFASFSGKNNCRFMRMFVPFKESELYEVCENAFCEYLNRYESSAKNELKLLLPQLFEIGAVKPISKLLTILGTEHLSELYDGDLKTAMSDLIIADCQSIEIWDAYFNLFFKESHNEETVLKDGLWFMQLNCCDEILDSVAASFFLYAMGKLPYSHPIFENTSLFEYVENFPNKHVYIYEQYIRDLWHNPTELKSMLSATEICNPFFKKALRHGKNLLIKNNADDNSNVFNMLEQLFINGASCEEIVYIFFNTFLKLYLNIEDLFRVANRYDCTSEILEVLKEITFEGTIKKYNIGVLVFASEYYYSKSQYTISLNNTELLYILKINEQYDCRQLKGRIVEYKITGYYNDIIQVGIFRQPMLDTEKVCDASLWEESISKFCENIVKPRFKKGFDFRELQISDFSHNDFMENCDFSLFTDAIMQNPEQLPRVLTFLKTAQWNILFAINDISISRNLYGALSKYCDKAVEMFKTLFEADLDIDNILDLYFNSIYKVIIPFDCFIALTEKEKMLKALYDRRIYCKLLDGENRHKCRLMNIACGPVCVVANANLLEDGRRIPARCIDYKVYDDGVGKIIFEDVLRETMTPGARGELFGYVAQNIKINSLKRERIRYLPDASELDVREIKFNLVLMAAAFKLRSSTGVELLRFVRTFGTKNPYSFQQDVNIDTLYLYKFYSQQDNTDIRNQIAQMILNIYTATNMAEIYLNTHYKYCMDIKEFALTICKRRPELSLTVASMFDNWEFDCAVDSQGNLVSYMVPHKSVSVGKEYALKCVRCRLSVLSNGNISARVTSVLDDSQILYPVLFSAMVGNDVEDILPHLKNVLKDMGEYDDFTINKMTYFGNAQHFKEQLSKDTIKAMADRTRPDKAELLARVDYSDILTLLAKKPINIFELTKAVEKLIEKNSSKMSAYEIETIVCEITETFIARSYYKEEIFKFLFRVFSSYSYYIRDNEIVEIWIKQLNDRFGEEVSAEFEKQIKSQHRYIKNDKF